jgi:uncharacterized protein (TIGR03437 family)
VFRLLLLVAVSASTGFAQAANSIASAGYSFSGATPVAPGQVISLFVPSLNVPNARATKTPWPTSLSGVSVVVPNPPNPAYPTALPILSVSSYLCEGPATQFCPAEIAVQVPYEPTCIPNQLDDCMFGPFGSLVLVAVQVNGVAGPGFLLAPSAGQPHFLNSCDSIFGSGGICLQQITHADGSLVGGFALPGVTPAHPGESVTIYAVGLGPTPHSKTGQAVAAPDALPDDVYLTPAILTDLGATQPFKGGASMEFGAPIKADWAGLVPGFVGLYQINVTLPATLPAGAAGCNGFEGGNVRMFWGNILDQDTVNTAPFVDVCVANN